MSDFSNVPIDFESIPQAENVDFLPINRKYLGIKIINDIFLWILLLLGIVGFKMFSRKPISFLNDYYYYFIGAMGFLCLLTVLLDVLGFQWKGYVLREKDVIYRTGLIFRKIVHIPYNRIQHAEVNQGVLERALSLAKLKIFTAGGSRSDLNIPGLLHDDALRMKSFILKKTGEDEY